MYTGFDMPWNTMKFYCLTNFGKMVEIMKKIWYNINKLIF